MRNIFNTVVAIALLSLAVSCNIGGNQGNDVPSNEQTSAINAPVHGGDSVPNLDKLPQVTKNYLDKYLPGYEIVRVIADNDDINVWLRTGEVLTFDIDGYIKEIECASGIPASVIDERILKDVKSIDPQANIVEIDKDTFGGYDVKLDNGMDINYDINCKRTGTDD